MKWGAVLAGCAAMCLIASADPTRAENTLGAPTLTVGAATPTELTLQWTVPDEDGGSAIVAYDVRLRVGEAGDEAVDSDWTLLEDVWVTDGGSYLYTITDLRDSTDYEAQVRAVNASGDGPWSEPRQWDTPDHADYSLGAVPTPIQTNGSVAGRIGTNSDEDWFSFTVPADTQLWLYSTGSVDVEGTLRFTNREISRFDRDSFSPPIVTNFSIVVPLGEEDYFISVSGQDGDIGDYRLHLRAVTLPGNTRETANDLTLGTPELGDLKSIYPGPSDADWFKFTLSSATEVSIIAGGDIQSIGELQNANGSVLVRDSHDYLIDTPGFMLRRSLDAGTYYVKVIHESDHQLNGHYTLLAQEVDDPGAAIPDARSLSLGSLAFGHISAATDSDYFSLTLDEEVPVAIYGMPYGGDFSLDATLVDADNTDIDTYVLDRSQFSRRGRREAFIVVETLPAGTHYIRVSSPAGSTGRYLLYAKESAFYGRLLKACSALDTPRSDPLYGCQVSLSNTGQFSPVTTPDINVEELWDNGHMGDGVNIAIVDTNIEARHEDLVDNVTAERNHDYYGSGLDFLQPHGTAVAGIIAARDNAIGMRGVAPRASIYSFNLLASSSSLDDTQDAMLRNLSDTAISNNSWNSGTSGLFTTVTAVWEAAVKRGVEEGFDGKGIFYVFSAGNGHGNDDYSNLDERVNFYAVTAVCAVGSYDHRALYSEMGPNLWVCAPGSDYPFEEDGIATLTTPNRYTTTFNGTSAAAPMVSGVAALIRAANPALTWRDVKLILAASARQNHQTSPGWETGAFKYRSATDRYRYHHSYGFGVVDAGAAVALAEGWENVPSTLLQAQAQSGRLNTTIPDADSSTETGPYVASRVTLDDSDVDFVEFVEVKINLDEGSGSARDYRIELESPSGAVSVLTVRYGELSFLNLGLYFATFPADFRFGSARHLGERPNGVWTLRVRDENSRGEGKLESWSIKVYGHEIRPRTPSLSVRPRDREFAVSIPVASEGGTAKRMEVRHIESSATNRTDTDWMVESTDWASNDGDQRLIVSGVTNGVSYDVQVRATNGAGSSDWSPTSTVTPNIQNSDPEFPESETANRSVAENTSPDTPIGRPIRADDPDQDSLTYVLDRGGDLFAINPSTGQLLTKAPLDYETDTSHMVTVSVSDNKDVNDEVDAVPDDTLDVTVAVSGLDEPPVVTGTRHYIIEEERTDYVGRFTVFDPEDAPTEWRLSGLDHKHFAISGNGDLRFIAVPDFEARIDHGADNVFDVVVGATDGALNGMVPVTVTITGLNEPPVIDGPSVRSFDENRTAIVYEFDGSDPEDTRLTWSVGGDDSDHFEISEDGGLTFKEPPNFEMAKDSDRNNRYEINILATDLEHSVAHSLSVNVLNVEEEGQLRLSSQVPRVGVPLRATLTDLDGLLRQEWSWERSSQNNNWDAISGARANSYTPVAADLDRHLRVTVEYVDGHGTSSERLQAATREMTQREQVLNNAPVFPSTTPREFSLPEDQRGGTYIGRPVTAIDTDNDTLTYSLTGSDLFVINQFSGRIHTADTAILDYERAPLHIVNVTVTDSALTDTITLTIVVTDVNEPPRTRPDLVSTNEDEPVIIDVLRNDTDPDTDDSLTVTGINTEELNGTVTVNAASVITYAPDADFNGVDHFVYTASDGYLNAEGSVTINVRGVNDAPVFTRQSTQRQVSQPARVGDLVGAPVTASDVDGDIILYRLEGPDAAYFNIEQHSAQITVAVGAPLETSTGSSYTVTVIADDRNGRQARQEVSITVIENRPTQIRPTAPGPAPIAPGPGPVEARNPADDFADLADAGVHIEPVRALTEQGVLTGTGCGERRLCPRRSILRWEMAVWIVRVLDGTDRITQQSGSRFEDAETGSWWSAHVERLAELGITMGCSAQPALYCPYEPVTRGQMASFLVRAFELEEASSSGFEDTANSVHAANIDALRAAGITQGCAQNPPRYCTRRATTRAQTASFLHRAIHQGNQ